MSDTWLGALAAQGDYNPSPWGSDPWTNRLGPTPEMTAQRKADEADRLAGQRYIEQQRVDADPTQAYHGTPRLDPGIRRAPDSVAPTPQASAFGEVGGAMLTDPLNYVPATAGPRAARVALQAMGSVLGGTDPAEAGVGSKLLKGARNYTTPGWDSGKKALNAAPVSSVQTVNDPYRMMYPGIYAHPREIAAQAATRVVPEDPMLKQLWGVTRDDLEQISRARDPNMQSDVVLRAQNARGSDAVRNVMTPANEQRLQDILGEAGKVPGLRQTDAWYMMDPMYRRLEEMFGPEEAAKRYRHLNTMTGMASPGSDVLTEIQRGTGAHWLERQGRFDDFVRYGGVAEKDRGANFPADMRYIGGHPYHKTSQAGPMQNYLQSEPRILRGEAPKVPEYVEAAGVPETGYQTASPVGDAHFSRGIGLADTRKGPTDVGASWSRSEYETGSPWWREKVARPLDLNAVQAQARLWNVLGPQTGVDSPIGAGKLELLSQQIAKASRRLGVSPETARDMILSGGAGAGALAFGIAPQMGSSAQQSVY